jgi:hypothetical protein
MCSTAGNLCARILFVYLINALPQCRHDAREVVNSEGKVGAKKIELLNIYEAFKIGNFCFCDSKWIEEQTTAAW